MKISYKKKVFIFGHRVEPYIWCLHSWDSIWCVSKWIIRSKKPWNISSCVDYNLFHVTPLNINSRNKETKKKLIWPHFSFFFICKNFHKVLLLLKVELTKNNLLNIYLQYKDNFFFFFGFCEHIVCNINWPLWKSFFFVCKLSLGKIEQSFESHLTTVCHQSVSI